LLGGGISGRHSRRARRASPLPPRRRMACRREWRAGGTGRPQCRALLAAKRVPEAPWHGHSAHRSRDRAGRARPQDHQRHCRNMDRGTTEGTLLIELGGRALEYRFTRRRRRTIGISVDGDGLTVVAPLRAIWSAIESFWRKVTRWILAKLDEWSRVPRAPL